MRSEKVTKLLPIPGVEGGSDIASRAKRLSAIGSITEFRGMKLCDDLTKTDVVFSSSEAEDMKFPTRTVLEVA